MSARARKWEPAEGSQRSYRGLVGRSSAMHRLFETLSRFDGTLLPVLVEGEVGVGKHRTARALHQGSPVAKGAFVIIDCAKHQGPLPFDSARDGSLVLSE